MKRILVCTSSYPRLYMLVQDMRPLLAALGGSYNSAQQKALLPDQNVEVYFGFLAKEGDEMRYVGKEYDYLHIVGMVDDGLVRKLKQWIGRRVGTHP